MKFKLYKVQQRALFFMFISFILISACDNGKSSSGDSVARQWNEVLLNAIRSDFARPTVHARNLFHVSAASYDAWAVFDDEAETYLLGKNISGFECPLDEESFEEVFDDIGFGGSRRNVRSDKDIAISYASYRIITHRFKFSPSSASTLEAANDLMDQFGYDIKKVSTNFSNGSAISLGNYIAECYINFGLQDGSNEANGYASLNYQPVNPPIEPELPGNPDIIDLDHWQVISLSAAIDQAGNPVSSAPPFLGPEWGRVVPFSLESSDKEVNVRDGFDYPVYFDPGSPPGVAAATFEEYKFNFSMVLFWSSHLDASSPVTIDISPASIGNNDIANFPVDYTDYENFYNGIGGGDKSPGHSKNPATGKAYPEQVVKLGDYTRVLAEFWADGPESETPPGHWFVILNEVNDSPHLVRRIGGDGDEVGNLEWDVKAYFALGGAMHDSAISAWGIKGWYDFIRPVSAIRAMADLGQSTSSGLASYHVNGLLLQPGYIELIETGDPLAGAGDVNVGKIKVLSWRGPDYIADPDTDQAGVGWILAENWWPYQRPTFVTPPFAGYVSGHSTFSRAAAEVLTEMTGSEFFPGGVGEFHIEKNEFLVFEEGPSEDMVLQWATYRDASDQCSLSRIWGGIHPPVDDIPGRIIGEKIGKKAFAKASAYFNPN